jgi:hypothetical protein
MAKVKGPGPGRAIGGVPRFRALRPSPPLIEVKAAVAVAAQAGRTVRLPGQISNVTRAPDPPNDQEEDPDD